MAREVPQSRGRPPIPGPLTPAERRILDHLRDGLTNAEIAARLGVSPDAVKYHVSNMLSKLELRDRRELAEWNEGGGSKAPLLAVLPALPSARRLLGHAKPHLHPGVMTLSVMGAVLGICLVVAIFIATSGGGDEETPVVVMPARAAPSPTDAAATADVVAPQPTPGPAPVTPSGSLLGMDRLRADLVTICLASTPGLTSAPSLAEIEQAIDYMRMSRLWAETGLSNPSQVFVVTADCSSPDPLSIPGANPDHPGTYGAQSVDEPGPISVYLRFVEDAMRETIVSRGRSWRVDLMSEGHHVLATAWVWYLTPSEVKSPID